jgi:hypothetical protein
MRVYRVYSMNEEGRILLAHEVRCNDDLAALAEAEKYSEDNATEVWEGGRLVARVKLSNAELNAQDSQVFIVDCCNSRSTNLLKP